MYNMCYKYITSTDAKYSRVNSKYGHISLRHIFSKTAFVPPRRFTSYHPHMNPEPIEITTDRDSIMQIIQETLRRLQPSVTVIRQVSYQEGRNPLIYSLSGQVEPFEVRDDAFYFEL